jgi:peptide/nickel transport system ATP-binding protein
LAPPYHPYTRMLLASATDDEPMTAPAGSPAAPGGPGGCGFAARCPHKVGPICDTTAPALKATSPSHAIACHLDDAASGLGVAALVRQPAPHRVTGAS